MTLDQLRALAHEFFEWLKGSGRQTVTPFSALLFAEHVLEMHKMHEMHEKSLEMHEKSLGAGNSAGVDALREAAQQALEALEDYKCSDDDRVSIAMHILSTALEPVQEPVAWMCPDDPERYTAFSWKAGHCENCGKQRIPLYIAPPQRKPLTDEEEK